LNNIEQARRFVSVLHGIGCQFALDNFGSGIGSVANLKQLSIDYLKIDGAFTRDLGERSINRELLSAMVRLSHSLDFMVVAEQVEDQESFDALRGLGVDFIQGFVVERPRPLAPTH
jgi:EAL domain-containing protein (putative c-di-GMP-specific phosphodiesterase class I)